jgi:hypothetical protein
MNFDRRQFLKVAGFGAASVATKPIQGTLDFLVSEAHAQPTEEEWLRKFTGTASNEHKETCDEPLSQFSMYRIFAPILTETLGNKVHLSNAPCYRKKAGDFFVIGGEDISIMRVRQHGGEFKAEREVFVIRKDSEDTYTVHSGAKSTSNETPSYASISGTPKDIDTLLPRLLQWQNAYDNIFTEGLKVWKSDTLDEKYITSRRKIISDDDYQTMIREVEDVTKEAGAEARRIYGQAISEASSAPQKKIYERKMKSLIYDKTSKVKEPLKKKNEEIKFQIIRDIYQTGFTNLANRKKWSDLEMSPQSYKTLVRLATEITEKDRIHALGLY